MANKKVDRLEVGANFPQAPNDEVVWIDVETNNINRYDESSSEWVTVGGSPAGTFDDPILKDNVRFTNSNDDVRLRIEHGGTGVVRLHAPEDDLALRSANDILLYAGDDGPGNVYIGWGDATITPDASNRVATIGDIQSSYSGSITFNGVQIIGGGTASSDGLENGTINLVPDADQAGDDQFLVIEPTQPGIQGAPGHIHLRAGGTIDESNADLILGGERNSLVVSDTEKEIKVSTAFRSKLYFTNLNSNSGTDFIVSETANILVGDAVYVGNNGESYIVDAVTASAGLATVTASGASFGAGAQYLFTREESYNSEWLFGSDGVLSGPSMGGLIVNGLTGTQTYDLYIQSPNDDIIIQSSGGDILLDADSGVHIGSTASPENQIATIGDLGVYPVTEITASDSFTVSFDHVGKTLYNVSGENVTCSVLLNADESIPVGSEIKFVNDNSSGFYFDIASEGITLVGEGQGFSNVNIMFWLPSNGYATLLKVATDNWILSGIRVTD